MPFLVRQLPGTDDTQHVVFVPVEDFPGVRRRGERFLLHKRTVVIVVVVAVFHPVANLYSNRDMTK